MHVRHVPLSFAQRLDTVWEVFDTSFSGQSRWWNLSWKIRANSSALLVLLPANEAMHVPWPGLETLAGLGRTVFRDKGSDEICPEKPVPTAVHFLVSLPANAAIHVASPNVCKPLEKSWARSFSGQSHWWNLWKPVPTALLSTMWLPPNGALPKLFPTVSHPSTMSSRPYRSPRGKVS